jgi:hypothetical protein
VGLDGGSEARQFPALMGRESGFISAVASGNDSVRLRTYLDHLEGDSGE